MATLLRLTTLALLLQLSGCSGMMFYPMKAWVQNPTRIGLGYEDIILIHPDGQRLHGWWLPAVGKPRGTVYYLHGNAQNISTHIMNVNWLPDAGFNVFLLDYSGYGLSEGKANLSNALDDIQVGLDWLGRSSRLQGKPLIVFGQSLGASMSVDVLARDENQGKAQCVVLEAAFSGYKTIANDVMKRSWLLWPMRPLVVPFMPSRDLDPINNIAQVSAPKLILHSKEDRLIPFAQGEAIYDKATAPKEFQPLLGGHIEAMRDADVRKRVLRFFSQRCGAAEIAPLKPEPAPQVLPEAEFAPVPVTPPLPSGEQRSVTF